MSDDIIDKYVKKLEEENKELKLVIVTKGRPILNIKGILDVVAKMWSDFTNSNGAQFLVGILGIVFIIATSVVSYSVLVPDKIPGRPTSKFHIQVDNNHRCYKISQDLDNGGSRWSTKCLEDREEAVKYLNKINAEYDSKVKYE